MAALATQITNINCKDKIKVVAKMSTQLIVGGEGGDGAEESIDLPRRADILVTEIFGIYQSLIWRHL